MNDWRHHAACKTADPNLFFAAHNEPAEVTAANAELVVEMYCNQCPVRIECLTAEQGSTAREHGVWGGLTERERHGPKRKPGGARKNDQTHTPSVRRALTRET